MNDYHTSIDSLTKFVYCKRRMKYILSSLLLFFKAYSELESKMAEESRNFEATLKEKGKPYSLS